MTTTEGPGLTEGIFAVLFVVLIYGIAGAIAVFLIGIIYNFIAKKFGGIEMEFETA